MAVTSKVYGLAQQSLANKEIDYDSDVIKVMLCTSVYVPDQDAHRYKSSVTNEVVGTGYAAGGNTLTAKTITYDLATNIFKLSAANPSWPGSTFTARYAVFYDDTPATDVTKPLICFWDFGQDFSSTAGAFDLTINAAGLVTMTAA